MILKLTNINIIKECNICLKIFDVNNNQVKTIYPNSSIINLDIDYGIYKIKLYCNNSLLDQVVIYHNKENQIIYYTYNNCRNTLSNIRKFIVYDYHYSNLKIERGNLLLKSII